MSSRRRFIFGHRQFHGRILNNSCNCKRLFKIIAEIGTEVAASGDVNGDGKVDVTDVTSIIDIVLNSK